MCTSTDSIEYDKPHVSAQQDQTEFEETDEHDQINWKSVDPFEDILNRISTYKYYSDIFRKVNRS